MDKISVAENKTAINKYNDFDLEISKEINNIEWRFYKAILDQLKKDKVITLKEWYFAIVSIRKCLGLRII